MMNISFGAGVVGVGAASRRDYGSTKMMRLLGSATLLFAKESYSRKYSFSSSAGPASEIISLG
jgi:hypothetical protein